MSRSPSSNTFQPTASAGNRRRTAEDEEEFDYSAFNKINNKNNNNNNNNKINSHLIPPSNHSLPSDDDSNREYSTNSIDSALSNEIPPTLSKRINSRGGRSKGKSESEMSEEDEGIDGDDDSVVDDDENNSEEEENGERGRGKINSNKKSLKNSNNHAKEGKRQSLSLKKNISGNRSKAGDDETEKSAPSRPSPAKLYNPADYIQPSLPPDLADLFAYITRFTPTDIELDTKFQPFIPDYIPAIGEIDPFLKVGGPGPLTGTAAGVNSTGKNVENVIDNLGLTVLDEPAAVQSDASVLELSLRVLSKGVSHRSKHVTALDPLNLQPKQINKWIDSIELLHKQKPSTTVRYTQPMPDIEKLMQAWPEQFESALQSIEREEENERERGEELNGDWGDLDLTPLEFTEMVCGLTDIPVYSQSTICESLHVLFTLYSEFANNSHFQRQ